MTIDALAAIAVLPAAMNDHDLRRMLAERGACTGLAEPDDMFPHPDDVVAVERARTVCGRCVVGPHCRLYARRIGAEHGMWGGQLHAPGLAQEHDEEAAS